jgi:hypothetical protein
MALLFPSSPTPGQIFSNGPNNWIWDGTAWTAAANSNYEVIYTNLDCGDLLTANDSFGVQTEGDIVAIDAMFPGSLATLDLAGSGPVTASPI